MLELEVKAIVPDAEALRAALRRAGATVQWAGIMRDRRLDQQGRFSERDEVVRVRAYEGEPTQTVIGWKGRTMRTPEGHKAREELEFHGHDDAAMAMQLLARLGFETVHAIDRRIETWRLEAATLRIEWYPRMDILLEVEGTAEAIERVIPATGIPRDAFNTDNLLTFAARYRERTGRASAVNEAELGGAPAVWGP